LLYSTAEQPSLFATHHFGDGKLSCLGPRSIAVQPETYRMPHGGRLACFTDGLADSVDQLSVFPTLLFDTRHAPESVLKNLNVDHPELVDDNLSVLRIMEGS
jgi:hypothetical protein